MLPVLLAFAVSVPTAPVAQGGAFAATVSDAKTARLELFGREHVLYPMPDGTRRALIGTTPQTKPGAHELRLRRKRLFRQEEVLRATVTVSGRSFASQSLSMPEEKVKLAEDPGARSATAKVREAVRGGGKVARWSGPFLEPAAGRRSSAYGLSRTVNKTRPWNWHRGIDIAAPAGAPVRAPAAGAVVLAGSFPLQGGLVVLDHGHGVFSVLMHMGAVSVKEGETVEAGARIGEVGSGGFSTGAHVHWGLYVGGEAVDPEPWLRSAP